MKDWMKVFAEVTGNGLSSSFFMAGFRCGVVSETPRQKERFRISRTLSAFPIV